MNIRDWGGAVSRTVAWVVAGFLAVGAVAGALLSAVDTLTRGSSWLLALATLALATATEVAVRLIARWRLRGGAQARRQLLKIRCGFVGAILFFLYPLVHRAGSPTTGLLELDPPILLNDASGQYDDVIVAVRNRGGASVRLSSVTLLTRYSSGWNCGALVPYVTEFILRDSLLISGERPGERAGVVTQQDPGLTLRPNRRAILATGFTDLMNGCMERLAGLSFHVEIDVSGQSAASFRIGIPKTLFAVESDSAFVRRQRWLLSASFQADKADYLGREQDWEEFERPERITDTLRFFGDPTNSPMSQQELTVMVVADSGDTLTAAAYFEALQSPPRWGPSAPHFATLWPSLASQTTYRSDLFFDFLLAQHADPNDKGERGRRPLHVALSASADQGHIDRLLKAGANPHLRDDAGMTPIHVASSLGQVEAVRTLLSWGASPAARDSAGDTPLHLAVRGPIHPRDMARHLSTALKLLRAGARTSARDNNGLTPLHLAAAAGSVSLVGVLLARGGKPNAIDNDGNTALHLAAASGGVSQQDVLRVLLGAGAEVNRGNHDGSTALHAAARALSLDAIAALCEAGADVGIHDALGHTPSEVGLKSPDLPPGDSLAQLALEQLRRSLRRCGPPLR